MPILAMLFMAQGMYRAFHPKNQKQPEVRHALDRENAKKVSP